MPHNSAKENHLHSLPEEGRETTSKPGVAGPDSMQEDMITATMTFPPNPVGAPQKTGQEIYRRPRYLSPNCPPREMALLSSSPGVTNSISTDSLRQRRMPHDASRCLTMPHNSAKENHLQSLPEEGRETTSKPGSSVDETESSQGLKRKNEVRAAEIKRVRKELKPVLQPRYLEYAERWMEENGVEPKELLEFVKSLQKETKSSAYSYILSWNPLSRFTTVTLSSVVTGQTFGAHQVIINQLKIRQLRVTELTTTNQHQCESIILFCPITSRAGSDVEAAMRNPAVAATDKRIFLVLLYHTRDVDYSTAGKSCAEKFDRVLSEFHVLFHETQNGLLRCEQNSQAIRELREAICAQFGIS